MTAIKGQVGSSAIVAREPASSRAMSAGLTRRLLRKPLGLASAIVILIIIASSALASLIAPYDPLDQNTHIVRQLPSAAHWLGTDSLGRDVLSRLLFGSQETLVGVLQAVVVMLIISVPLGIISGYLGGRADSVILRVVDLLMSIPSIIITLAVLAIFDSSMFAAMITVGVLASGAFIRVIRSAVLGVRQELYVGAARVAGLGRFQIMVRHVLPQARGVLLVQVSLFAAATLGIQTGLAFLGFGPPPPAPSWGGMVAEAASLIHQDPWLLVPSGGIIAITTLAFGLLGDALRDSNQERFTLASTFKRQVALATGGERATVVEALSSTTGAVLSVRNLRIGYGSVGDELTVVENVDFDIAPGEIVGLVGESGSGKTVTALSLLGLLGATGRVTGGSILFQGNELVGLSSAGYRGIRGSGIAMISQEPMVALDPSFRVGAQIAEAVRTHDRCSRAEAKVRTTDLLRAVKLPPEVASRYPHQISGGMAQRIAIAEALAGRPKLLIADEPTTALDVTVQADILDLLRSLQQDTGMAVLLVTHDWGVVGDICSRAVVMYAGQVVERASVDEMYRRPRHPYTLGLLESSPHLAKKGEPLPTIGGMVPPPRDWPTGCHFAARCPFATDACREAPIPMADLGDGRASRCIHIDLLVKERP